MQQSPRKTLPQAIFLISILNVNDIERINKEIRQVFFIFFCHNRDGLSRGAFYVASVYFRRWRTYYSEPRSAEKCTSDKMEHLVRHIEGFAVILLLFCFYTLSYDPPSFHYILPYRLPLVLQIHVDVSLGSDFKAM